MKAPLLHLTGGRVESVTIPVTTIVQYHNVMCKICTTENTFSLVFHEMSVFRDRSCQKSHYNLFALQNEYYNVNLRIFQYLFAALKGRYDNLNTKKKAFSANS